jgi:hypothetical protein
MNIKKACSRVTSYVTRSELPSEGERYYDVLFGSEAEVKAIRKEGDEVIVLEYADDGRRRPFSEESWAMALESGRFERVEESA